jgi:hypothetical protein
MVHLDQAEPTPQRPLPPFIDLASLTKEGNWGIYHEVCCDAIDDFVLLLFFAAIFLCWA